MDLVINKMKAWQGSLGISEHRGIVSPAYFVARPVREFNRRFVHYLLRSSDYLVEYQTRSAGIRVNQWDLDWEDFRRIPILLPPTSRQQRIANFLDAQTARIDALIAEKERLLLAINDFTKAKVSQLLTTGGRRGNIVETGNVFVPKAPVNWRVAPLKRAIRGMSQGRSPQCENRPAEASEWGVLKVGCVNGLSFNPEENKALPSELEPDLSCVLRKNDVLISRANTRELVGLAALVEQDHPNLLLCDKLYRLDLREDWVTPAFVVLALRAENSRYQVELGASGASSSMQNISQDVLRELVVAFPPLEEQHEIVDQARQVLRSVQDLDGHVATHIDRLREYRSSLISAAVMGQLNIDEFQARQLEAA
jgi:type I restriction enzyme S subunit